MITCIYGLNKNLFDILSNIPTAVYLTQREHICKCEIYAQLILMDICVGTKLCHCGGG